jgi:dTDP-glucose pyrophosphorylase/CBS domain-containing protein
MLKNRTDISLLTVRDSANIREAMASIDRGERQIALVINANEQLVATVTDGDIRRALLRGASLDTPLASIMCYDFTAILSTDDTETARQLMQLHKLHQVPVVNEAGCPIDLIHIDRISGIADSETRVILMAGGLGTRLRPLTETVPKPMLEVGNKPILETILGSFAKQGFHDFTISLNYKGSLISDYFGDGSKYGVRIDYICEAKRMGTAGALSLLSKRPTAPFIVMNGDLLTDVSFDSALRFHAQNGAIATMCAREFSMQVPFGVIEVQDTSLHRIVEKPTHTHLVNAGIYVLSPEALDYVEPDAFLDMTDLFERMVADSRVVSVFPIQEFWLDIGRMEDLERARNEFDGVVK